MKMNEGDILRACTPRTWDPMTSEMKLFHLSETSEEFKKVVRKINRTLNVQVKSVLRIQNPYLWGCYQLKKLEYIANKVPVREVEMFHCTAQANITSIASDNLDWRKCVRLRFVKGVCFSPSAAYSNYYANPTIGMNRALILTTVLVGREILGKNTMLHPPKLFDTGFRRRYGKTMEYVKYNDYEFYPSYVAYYTKQNRSEMIRFRTDPYHQCAWYPHNTHYNYYPYNNYYNPYNNYHYPYNNYYYPYKNNIFYTDNFDYYDFGL